MSKNVGRGQTPQSQSNYYEIHVEEHLAPHWLELFEGVTVTHNESGETVLSGFFEDQSALHGFLARLRDMNLTLVGLNRVDEGLSRRERKS